jgi:hypothetical protein
MSDSDLFYFLMARTKDNDPDWKIAHSSDCLPEAMNFRQMADISRNRRLR